MVWERESSSDSRDLGSNPITDLKFLTLSKNTMSLSLTFLVYKTRVLLLPASSNPHNSCEVYIIKH